MELEVYVDESGRPGQVQPSAKRRQRLFVVAALAVDQGGAQGLAESYRELLELPLGAAGGQVTLGELFALYRRVTGRKPELKAGWIVNSQGPFAVLRDAPPETRQEILTAVMSHALSAAMRHAQRIYIVVVDKVHAYRMAPRIEQRAGLRFNLRVFALDFILTRLASTGSHYTSIRVIHDNVSESQLIKEYVAEAARRGYIYNPRLRTNPETYRRISIEFRDSAETPLLQYADLIAYAARALRSGTAPPPEESIYRRSLCIQRGNAKTAWINYPGH